MSDLTTKNDQQYYPKKTQVCCYDLTNGIGPKNITLRGHIGTLETVLYIEAVLDSEVIYSGTSL